MADGGRGGMGFRPDALHDAAQLVLAVMRAGMDSAHMTDHDPDQADAPNDETTSPADGRLALVAQLLAMRSELRDQPETWENADLESFLEALGAWIQDAPGAFAERGEVIPDPPGWDVLAQALQAARIYD